MTEQSRPPAGAAGAKGDVEIVQPGALQQAFARRVAESKATAPHVYFERSLDVRPTVAAMLKATASALRELPLLNAAYRDGHFELYPRINVGFGVTAHGTLLVPVIHDAADKEPAVIEAEIEQLSARARAGTITSPELAGGTFTIIAMAENGVSRFTPVIHRGQAATLGIGADALTLACDNRIIQGAEGAEFLDRLLTMLAA
jgi:pyruvate dehydrogenase E2 component (dihydrolipoamide acetyltransferase)